MEELLRAGISWETGDLGAARDNRCLAVRGPGRVGGRAEDPACSIRAFFAFAFRFCFSPLVLGGLSKTVGVDWAAQVK